MLLLVTLFSTGISYADTDTMIFNPDTNKLDWIKETISSDNVSFDGTIADPEILFSGNEVISSDARLAWGDRLEISKDVDVNRNKIYLDVATNSYMFHDIQSGKNQFWAYDQLQLEGPVIPPLISFLLLDGSTYDNDFFLLDGSTYDGDKFKLE